MWPFSDPPNPWLAILPTILGGLIAGCVGLFLSGWQRRRDAKNSFLIEISLIKKDVKSRHFYEFHVESLKEVKTAIYRVLPFLSQSRIERLLTEWQSYYDIGEAELLDRYESEGGQIIARMKGETPPTKPSDILKSSLDRMSKIVK